MIMKSISFYLYSVKIQQLPQGAIQESEPQPNNI